MKTLEVFPSMYAGWGNRMTKPVVVEVRPNGCWVVISHKPGGSGYSRLRIGNNLMGLHRYTYEQKVGAIPKGHFVCHRCDERMCINPEHLFVGTPLDNNRDMFSKDRGCTGNKLKQIRYSRDTIQAILADKRPVKEILEQYGISKSYFSLLRSGKRRKDARE